MKDGQVHDRTILDALDAIEPIRFSGEIWRVTVADRDPLSGTHAHGRWSPAGEFEVLYTSLTKEGAIAEIGYRLSLEPVWPSRITHTVHLLQVTTTRTLRFATLESLAGLGVEPSKYQTFDYTSTQAIASAAYFLEFDGLIVPSARADSLNLVLFLERLYTAGTLSLAASDPVDWNRWQKDRKRK